MGTALDVSNGRRGRAGTGSAHLMLSTGHGHGPSLLRDLDEEVGPVSPSFMERARATTLSSKATGVVPGGHGLAADDAAPGAADVMTPEQATKEALARLGCLHPPIPHSWATLFATPAPQRPGELIVVRQTSYFGGTYVTTKAQVVNARTTGPWVGFGGDDGRQARPARRFAERFLYDHCDRLGVSRQMAAALAHRGIAVVAMIEAVLAEAGQGRGTSAAALGQAAAGARRRGSLLNTGVSASRLGGIRRIPSRRSRIGAALALDYEQGDASGARTGAHGQGSPANSAHPINQHRRLTAHGRASRRDVATVRPSDRLGVAVSGGVSGSVAAHQGGRIGPRWDAPEEDTPGNSVGRRSVSSEVDALGHVGPGDIEAPTSVASSTAGESTAASVSGPVRRLGRRASASHSSPHRHARHAARFELPDASLLLARAQGAAGGDMRKQRVKTTSNRVGIALRPHTWGIPGRLYGTVAPLARASSATTRAGSRAAGHGTGASAGGTRVTSDEGTIGGDSLDWTVALEAMLDNDPMALPFGQCGARVAERRGVA